MGELKPIIKETKVRFGSVVSK